MSLHGPLQSPVLAYLLVLKTEYLLIPRILNPKIGHCEDQIVHLKLLHWGHKETHRNRHNAAETGAALRLPGPTDRTRVRVVEALKPARTGSSVRSLLVRPGAPFEVFLFLVAMPGAPFVASDRCSFEQHSRTFSHLHLS